jgi:hypothetical protein
VSLFNNFFIFENDINVPSFKNKQKNLREKKKLKNLLFVGVMKVTEENNRFRSRNLTLFVYVLAVYLEAAPSSIPWKLLLRRRSNSFRRAKRTKSGTVPIKLPLIQFKL